MKEKTLKLWYRDDGVNDYLHNHSLSKNSLVVDIGCYKGKWIKRCQTLTVVPALA